MHRLSYGRGSYLTGVRPRHGDADISHAIIPSKARCTSKNMLVPKDSMRIRMYFASDG